MTDLNKLMAEKVMGWHSRTFKNMKSFPIWQNSKNEDVIMVKDWNPLENIAQAMECLHFWLDQRIGRWYDLQGHSREIICNIFNRYPVPQSWRGNAKANQEGTAIVKAIAAAIGE